MALIILAVIGALVTLAASVAGLLIAAEGELRDRGEALSSGDVKLG